jgi:hypothetical protein
MPRRVQIIPPDAYPPLVRKSEAVAIAQWLCSADTIARGEGAIADQEPVLRAAVHRLVDDLERAGKDRDLVALAAHEIRGLAENARLAAAGRIAGGLCHYFDESRKLGQDADPAIIDLHVGAILRAAHHRDEAARMSGAVARELAVLVDQKLTGVNC